MPGCVSGPCCRSVSCCYLFIFIPFSSLAKGWRWCNNQFNGDCTHLNSHQTFRGRGSFHASIKFFILHILLNEYAHFVVPKFLSPKNCFPGSVSVFCRWCVLLSWRRTRKLSRGNALKQITSRLMYSLDSSMRNQWMLVV